MEALRQLYQNIGFTDVVTYIQSGNVVFRDNKSTPEELEKIIANQIQQQFGFIVPVVVLTINQLRDIVEKNPFLVDLSKDISFLHVTFLSAKPERINHQQISDKRLPDEAFEIIEKVVYLYCPNGYGNTKLTNNFLELTLKVTATTRNWKTTKILLELSEKLEK
jgi:uncharacterized protein (DUF1697 family)